jgi:histidinol-phosphatase (PHP family)
MLATYHNHTNWSDGKGTIADLIDGAVALGVQELGVSDHYVLHPSGRTPGWSMPIDRLGAYVAEIEGHREEAARRGVTLRTGLEVDWFPGHTDAIREVLAPFDFDYLIGSVHEIEHFTIDSSPAPWTKLDEAGINAAHREYWIRMKSLAESGLFDIAAHLDLAKKFAFYPTEPPLAEIDAALDALAEADVTVELNTAGWHKPCADAYPSLEILTGCVARGIVTTLSADAHQAGHLLRDFDRGAGRLREAGFAMVARFASRECTLESLDDATPVR